MNDACVIGYGVVGRATARTFAVKKYYDLKESNITLREAYACKYIFICLPTPTIDGKCDVRAITEIIDQFVTFPRYVDNILIIRSTVYPGYARFLQKMYSIANVVSNPEFLSESTWEEDIKTPKLVVIGGDERKYVEDVKALYLGRYKYMLPLVTDSVTAEFIKYAMNTWFATKVAFFNELYDYSRKTKANYESVKKAIASHPWGTKNHMEIFYKEKRGIHGHCLPKDLEAFATMTQSPFFKMIIERNETYV